MPKRVLDGEGFWGSRKLRRCPVWIRREYPYLYPLADCNGNFELDIPVILGKLKPNRPDFSIHKLELVFEAFDKEGVAFIWTENGRKYVHWTGSRRKGRLPRLSRRTNKYERRLTPPLPMEQYAEYLQRFGETPDASGSDTETNPARVRARVRATDRAMEPRFEKFWEAYPRKVGKPAAQRAWNKVWKSIPLGGFRKILDGLERWKQTEQWQKEEGKFIPYPATFLNQRRWEDDPPEVKVIRELDAMAEQVAFGIRPPKKCKCGAEIPAGFLKCLNCMKKKAPVKP